MAFTQDLHFKTNVQLKSIIGKDLINDDNIAILELVKNSFDADAKKVNIEFSGLKDLNDEGSSKIVIKDNGVGMDLLDITDKWLNIAFSEKKEKNRQHNRMMAGAKGVGRFSCDRLGEYLNLYTKQKTSKDYIKIIVDWKAFEIDNDKDKEIQSIPIGYELLTKDELSALGIEPFEHGVLLEIVKLRSKWVYPIKNDKDEITDWNTNKLIELKKYLEKLINPNQAFENNDFGIYLNAPEFEEENSKKRADEKFIGKVENTIFEKLDFKSTSIETKITDNGKVIYTELKDKGEIIFWIKEKNEFFPEIKNVKIILYYLNPYAKAFFTKQTGVRSVDYGSVYVFLNGFRVPPYGEFGDDWLNLEARKGQGYARFLSQRELVGRIEILDFNNDFKVISSREGIVKNESYKKLTDPKSSYFFKTFRRLEKYVVDGLDWDSVPEDEKISEIERKIISGETKEEDLSFRESDNIKRKRIYSSIHSIISSKPENVIELYINENLILDKINEEKENSAREFEQLISDFENKKIDGDILNRILLKKAEQNKDLEKQLADFSKYTTSEATAKALLELQHYKETSEKQAAIIQDLLNQLNKINEEKEKEVAAIKQNAEKAIYNANLAKEIAIKEKEELKIEKEKQILFQQKLLTKEVIDLLDYHHVIGIAADTIDKHLINLNDQLNRGKTPTKEDLIDLIKNISYESKKIISLTNLATASNFSAEADEIDADLPDFIRQYTDNLSLRTYGSNKLTIEFESEINQPQFFYHFKPIEIAIILDNLFSNSRKAKATKINVSIKKGDNNTLKVLIKDNGPVGIKKEIQDKIFDFGFTTTSGSGLGLHHIKTIMEDQYNGNIAINKELNSGAEFILTFTK